MVNMGQNRFTIIKKIGLVGVMLAFVIFSGMVSKPKKWRQSDLYTHVGKINFWKDIEPFNPDGSVNVIIEIPAGSSETWKISPSGNEITREFKNGQPTKIDYLAYPCNIGIVPQTMKTQENQTPKEVAILGKAISRGTIIPVKVIGILNIDRENDDIIIAVPIQSPLSIVNDLKELDESFPGLTLILKTWFQYYQGENDKIPPSFGNVKTAHQIVMNGYKNYLNYETN